MKRKLRVRQAQTVLPFGVGAVLDVQGESFVAAGIERWPDLKTPVPSDRLATRLGVKGFFAAPHTLNDRYDKADRPGVPYVRFPGWLFCGSCRAMVRFLREHEAGRAARVHVLRRSTPPHADAVRPHLPGRTPR